MKPPSLKSLRGRAPVIVALIVLLVSHLSFGATVNLHSRDETADNSSWTLVWSDEFDGPNGSGVDAQKWVMETGGGGWGNNELEYYTNRTQNAYLENGALVIKAVSERYTGPDGVTRNYTSARLKTQGKFAQAYGRFEARIKIPYGQGIWPAFWMLGSDIGQVGWPKCGEIDVMENIGREPATVHGTIHGPGYSGGSGIGAPYTLPNGGRFADAYHVYAVEWEPKAVRWYVDDALYKTTRLGDLPAGTNWVFDHPFFILLNVAVGGNWPGSPDATTIFPQLMLIDYVRVYQRKVASVSAASFQGDALASESIVSAFGANLATAAQSATALPLPFSLGGTTVKVKDSLGAERSAPLFFVSPNQVNFQMPQETATGAATITVAGADGSPSVGVVQIAPVAPGIFTFNSDGQGVAAGYVLRYRNGQEQPVEPIAQLDAQRRWITSPIDLGPATDQVFLILFGTGIRFHSQNPLAVTARIGSEDVDVLYAGPQGGFVGLDQINLRLSQNLRGSGEVDVALMVDSQASNTVQVNIR